MSKKVLKMRRTAFLFMFSILILLLAFVVTVKGEYTAPCTNGSRMTGDAVQDICGIAGAQFRLSGAPTVQNRTDDKPPFTPNIAYLNSSAGGDFEYYTGTKTFGAPKSICMMSWVKVPSTRTNQNNMIMGTGWTAMGFGASDCPGCGRNNSLMVVTFGGGGGCTCRYSHPFSTGDWHSLLFGITTDGSSGNVNARGDFVGFFDSQLWFNESNVYDNYWTGDTYFFGMSIGSNGFTGGMDHFVIIEGDSCTQALADAFNMSTTPTNHYVYGELFNTTPSYNITDLKELNLFFPRANYSIDGTPSTNAVCRFNASNLTAVWNGLSQNFTFADTTTVYGLNSSDESGTVLYSSTRFRMCRTGASDRTMQLFANGGLFKTYSGFPSCTNGTYLEELNITTLYNSQRSFNITLQCSNCNAGNGLRLIQLPSGGNFNIRRTFSAYGFDTMAYNASTGWWEYKAHFSSFDTKGSFPMTYSCNASYNYTRVVGAGELEPIALLLEINGSSFANNTLLETGNISVVGDCRAEVINVARINLSFANGTFINSTLGQSAFYDPKVHLTSDGVFNVTLYCQDDDGQVNTDMRTFIINDTTAPGMVWYSPLADNTTSMYVNNNLTLNALASDLDLFSVKIDCFSPVGLSVYSFYVENLTGTQFQLVNATANITNTGTGWCNSTVKDAHTYSDISSKMGVPIAEKNSLSFRDGEITLNISVYGVDTSEIKIVQEKDRYTFEPVLKSKPSLITYYVDCDAFMYYRVNSRYPAHFVCKDFWVDFDMRGLTKKNYVVTRVNDYRYRVDINGISGLENLATKSIGVLNIRNDRVNFTVASLPVTSSSTALSESTAFFPMVIIWIALVFFGTLIAPLFFVFAGLFGIILSLVFVPVYGMLGYTFVGLNVIILLMGAFLMWDN